MIVCAGILSLATTWPTCRLKPSFFSAAPAALSVIETTYGTETESGPLLGNSTTVPDFSAGDAAPGFVFTTEPRGTLLEWIAVPTCTEKPAADSIAVAVLTSFPTTFGTAVLCGPALTMSVTLSDGCIAEPAGGVVPSISPDWILGSGCCLMATS